MKKYFTLLSLVFLLNSSWATAEEALVRDPIVIVNKALEFGIWRIYNDGSVIHIVDRIDGNYFRDYLFSSKDGGLSLFSTGTASQANVNTDAKEEALQVESKGELQDGRYGFLDQRFVVKGDTLTIFDIDDELSPGNVSSYQVLKKNSNGLTHTGTETTTIVEPSQTTDGENVVVPTGTPGDCLAKYFPATGEVVIPCLSVDGEEKVYHVKQHQLPGTMTFEVGDGDVTPVQ